MRSDRRSGSARGACILSGRAMELVQAVDDGDIMRFSLAALADEIAALKKQEMREKLKSIQPPSLPGARR